MLLQSQITGQTSTVRNPWKRRHPSGSVSGGNAATGCLLTSHTALPHHLLLSSFVQSVYLQLEADVGSARNCEEEYQSPTWRGPRNNNHLALTTRLVTSGELCGDGYHLFHVWRFESSEGKRLWVSRWRQGMLLTGYGKKGKYGQLLAEMRSDHRFAGASWYETRQKKRVGGLKGANLVDFSPCSLSSSSSTSLGL